MGLTDGKAYVVMHRKGYGEDYRRWGAYCYFKMAMDVALRLKQDYGWHAYVLCTTEDKLPTLLAS